MKSRDFVYWLQGYFEISEEGNSLSKDQVTLIRKHLALVFKHEIDPAMGDTVHQAELDKIHGKPSNPPPHAADILFRC